MKTRIVKLIVVVTLFSMLDTAGGISLTPASNAMTANSARPADSKARRLEGTWEVQVTLRNCQTGVCPADRAGVFNVRSGWDIG